MFDQLQIMADRYEELGGLLSDPEVVNDTKRFMALSKEEASLRETVAAYARYVEVTTGISDAKCYQTQVLTLTNLTCSKKNSKH